jgi:hypothetical protein
MGSRLAYWVLENENGMPLVRGQERLLKAKESDIGWPNGGIGRPQNRDHDSRLGEDTPIADSGKSRMLISSNGLKIGVLGLGEREE